ncbi:histidine triad nucleotide-binding protein [Nakamurella aerolata]|uniref:Histidine triad nucleotide-binding protein n=1 Tax=Nakamurella aerolata TaxID=1656892 RepID=A0A849ABH7_9ACTN|nr:histidine triad nucleotide-binding protein [Nakamurella aerolata]NNG36501.1 histidine triad nucleotide-binding protein [Nakamurella aerolata]
MADAAEVPKVSDCLFCKIVAGEIPADVVRRDERTVAFRDVNPQAPTHVLVVPVEHQPNVAASAAADPAVVADLIGAANEVAAAEGLVSSAAPGTTADADPGYRLVVNTGAGAGQSVFHTHVHLVGGRPLAWPPG